MEYERATPTRTLRLSPFYSTNFLGGQVFPLIQHYNLRRIISHPIALRPFVFLLFCTTPRSPLLPVLVVIGSGRPFSFARTFWNGLPASS